MNRLNELKSESLPKTWRLVPVGMVLLGTQYGTNEPSIEDGNTRVVGMKDIQQGKVLTDDLVTSNLLENEREKYLLHRGDILMNRTNSYDLVGKVGLFDSDEKVGFASYLVKLAIDTKQILPEFLNYWLNGQIAQKAIKRIATRAISQANINPTEFKKYCHVPIPQLPEQSSIIDLLSTWDSAIEKTEQLIAAKEKHLCALRELFFKKSQRAKRSKLKDVTHESTARNGTHLGREAIMAVTKGAGMRPMKEETIAASIKRYKVVQPRAFAYNPMRLNIGSIAMSPFDTEVLVSPDYVVFECDESKLLSSYLNHLRHSRHWANYFGTAGSGSVRVRIYYHDFSSFTFDLPPLDVQKQLVNYLDTAWLEIDLLKGQAEAYRRQKRGLMQKLLTGKWRVKEVAN